MSNFAEDELHSQITESALSCVSQVCAAPVSASTSVGQSLEWTGKEKELAGVYSAAYLKLRSSRFSPASKLRCFLLSRMSAK